jgi:prepilin peptidase CpaA
MLPVVEAMPLAVVFSLIALLLISTVTDIAWRRIPNVILAPALMLALAMHTYSMGINGLLVAVSGLAAGLAILLPIYALGGMAAGDVKLLGVVGAYLGPWGALVAGLATLIAGAVLGIFYIAWRSLQPLLAQQFEHWVHARHHTHSISTAIRDSGLSRSNREFAYAPAIAAGSLFSIWQPTLLTIFATGA